MDRKKNFARIEKIFRPSSGIRVHAPQENFEKIVFSIC